MDEGPFCEIDYTAGDDRVRKGLTLCSKVLGVMCSRGCWGKTWAQEINPKLTSESTINCSYACGKVVTNEPELGGGLVNCSDCMKCVPWWSLSVEDNWGVAQRDREISHRSLSRYSHKWGKKKAGGSWGRGWRWCGNTPYCFCFLRTWMQYPANY